jgi:adenosylmethionine-8-amino-7-oxononanoate aminotransferase
MDVHVVASPDCFTRAPGATWAEHSRASSHGWKTALARHHDADRGGDRRAPGAVRRRHAHVRSGLSETPARRPATATRCTSSPMRSPSASAAPALSFACEQAAIRPDLLCLSKGLTGGYLPLSVVMTTDEIYAAFYDEYVKLNAFLHSHSYTGNPLACAAARASLAIFDDRRGARAQSRALGTHACARAQRARRSCARRRGASARHDRGDRAHEGTKQPVSPMPGRSAAACIVYRHAL